MSTQPPFSWPPPTETTRAPRRSLLWLLSIPVALAVAATILIVTEDPPRSSSSSSSGGFRSVVTPLPNPSAGGLDIRDPRVLGGVVVVTSIDGFRGLDLTTGDMRWQVDCFDAHWASPIPGSNPDVELGTCRDQYVAIDARRQQLLWQTNIDIIPDRVRVGPSYFVVQNDANGVEVHDLATGDQMWHDTSLGSANIATSTALVYFSSDRGVTAYSVRKGLTLWTVFTPTSGLVATEDAVFARTNAHEVYRLDPTSGRTVAQSVIDPSSLDWSDFVAVTNDAVVLLGTRAGRVVSVFDRTTVKKLWYRQDDGQSALDADDDVVAISNASENSVSTYDLHTGDHLTTYSDASPGRPDLYGGRLYFVAFENGVAVLRIERTR